MKDNFTIKCMIFVMLLVGVTSCTDERISDPLASEAGVNVNTPQVIKGEVSASDRTVKYRIEEIDPLVFQLQVNIGDHELKGHIAFAEGVLEFDGNNALLNKGDKRALLEVAQHLFSYVDAKEGNVSYAEYSLIRTLEYWSNAPTGYAYRFNQQFSTAQKSEKVLASRNEGVTCIRKNTTVTAQYDDSRGSQSDRVRVGSTARPGYGCMGRCGGDCGQWWIPSAWTKDCMDHDQCSNVNFSSGGSSDSNCGDEFDEAADDWIFGVSRGCFG
ncbi:MAG: hypothetical protein AAFX87_04800 [Bacteroidota bacterium]